MIRVLALALCLVGPAAAFAQQPVPAIPPGMVDPEHDPNNNVTPEQKCQATCAQAMQKCMMPCMGGNPEEAAKPENRSKTMACVKRCGASQEPCMQKCDALKEKEKKKQ